MEDHVHQPDYIGEGLLLLAVKGAGLEFFAVGDVLCLLISAARKTRKGSLRSRGPRRRSSRRFAADDGEHGADERARRVILAAVPSGVAHGANLRLIEVGEFMLFSLRVEAEGIDQLDDFAEVVAGLELVFEFAEDLADLVLDGVGRSARCLKPFK